MIAIKPKTRIRTDIAAMEAYTPTASLEVFAEKLGIPIEKLIKLDANENPYGPSPKALDALANLDTVSIYPDPESGKLRALLADYVGIDAQHIIVGAGADELLELVLQLFIEPGDTIINCPATFGMYSFNAPIFHAKAVNVPRKADFSLDVEGIKKTVEETNAKLLFACSPNNPDGSLIPEDTLNQLLELPITIILDEAYMEFAEAESMVKRVPETENLIVLRTFSKWAGLAGLRVGYGVFPLELMTHLWKIKQPYNVNVAADAAARASLNDLPYLRQNIQRIITERQRLQTELATIPFLLPYPSQSNFILCKVLNQPAIEVKNQLAQQGILIRHYQKTGLNDHIRISVGTREQTNALLAVLRQLS